MFDDARSQHLQLFVREGYRSEKQQEEIMQEYIGRYEKMGHNYFLVIQQAIYYLNTLLNISSLLSFLLLLLFLHNDNAKVHC